MSDKINIKLEDTIEVACSECGGKTFIDVVLIRKTSKVLTGTESLIPIQILECSVCGTILEESLPVDYNL